MDLPDMRATRQNGRGLPAFKRARVAGCSEFSTVDSEDDIFSSRKNPTSRSSTKDDVVIVRKNPSKLLPIVNFYESDDEFLPPIKCHKVSGKRASSEFDEKHEVCTGFGSKLRAHGIGNRNFLEAPRFLGDALGGGMLDRKKHELVPPNASRTDVQSTIKLYREILANLMKDNGRRRNERTSIIYLKAASLLKKDHGWVNSTRRIGLVPGVEVGDKFQSRAELYIIGLHCQFNSGIDYLKDGEKLATSIVDSGRYENETQSSDIMIYSGQGGNPSMHFKCQIEDQKLERGNLALVNSMHKKTPVRVIRRQRFKAFKKSTLSGNKKLNIMYVYDGLYYVEDYKLKKVDTGKHVYKFLLRRKSDQPKLTRGMVMEKPSSCKMGAIINDISYGKEDKPIRVVNTVDFERPPSFIYQVKVTYPPLLNEWISTSCNFTNGCSDSEDCVCKGNSGGDIPYDYGKGLVTREDVIYECGPLCKCFTSCLNRTSQHGISFQLEVFKNKSREWGVRSRSLIPSGSFVCEYIGEIFMANQVGQGKDYIFDIGTGFVIDATRCGNFGRFITHSSTPNLSARKVLYDHHDHRVPHIMLFAIKNICPFRELTVDYNELSETWR